MNYSTIILALSFLTLSCSKEKRTENKIIHNWTISSSHSTMTNDSNGEQSDYNLNYVGNVSFQEDHNGQGDTSSSNPFPVNFTWTNTEDKLIIDESNSNTEFIIDEFTKTRMYLKHVPTDQNFPGYTYREYMVLMKAE